MKNHLMNQDVYMSGSYVTDSTDYVSSTENTNHFMSQQRKLDDLLHSLNQKPSSFEESPNEVEHVEHIEVEQVDPIAPINEENQNVKNSCCCLY